MSRFLAGALVLTLLAGAACGGTPTPTVPPAAGAPTATLAAAATNTTAPAPPTDTSAPAPPTNTSAPPTDTVPPPTATAAAPAMEPLTTTGSGTQDTKAFTLPAGNFTITWQATAKSATGCFHGASLKPTAAGAFFSASAGSGTAKPTLEGATQVYHVEAGQYYWSVTSGCEWSLTIAPQQPLVPPATAPVTLQGTGTLDTTLFTLAAGNYTITWKATATSTVGCFHGANLHGLQGFFSKSAGSGQVQDTLTGSTEVYGVDAGEYYLSATSGCQWEITIKPQ